jgi:drug/metabolite transporter (DMT)-like permease
MSRSLWFHVAIVDRRAHMRHARLCALFQGTFSQGRYTYDQFNHPFFQAMGMFIGESLCLIAFFAVNYNLKRQGLSDQIERASPDFRVWLFAAPACCDLLGTSLMYLGLTYTAASTFQMLRGSVVIFTGIFSVVFLGRRLFPYHWFGMLLVLSGLACVGVSSILYGSSNDASKPILGDTLVIIAQLVAATQMVVEEKLLDKYKVPALQAVGMEGVFGRQQNRTPSERAPTSASLAHRTYASQFSPFPSLLCRSGMFFMFILLIIFQNVPGLPGE